jgi:tetratricopeptide (TPR) repeat protein
MRDALRELADGGAPDVTRPSSLERTGDLVFAHRLAATALLATAAAAGTLAWQFTRPDLAQRSEMARIAAAAARAEFARAWLAAQGEELSLGARPGARAAAPVPGAEQHLTGAIAAAEEKRRSGDLAGALAALRPAVVAAPDDPLAQALVAVATLQSGDKRVALHELERAWRLLPDATPLAGPLSELLRRVGRERFEADEFPAAAAHFELLAALQPLNDEAWRQLAITRLRLGDHAGARVAVDRLMALPLSGGDRDAAMRTDALSLDSPAERQDGIAVLREIVARSPDYKMARLSLGLLFDKECQLAAAREQYDVALELEPDRPETLLALAWLHSGSNRAKCAKCAAAFEETPEL